MIASKYNSIEKDDENDDFVGSVVPIIVSHLLTRVAYNKSFYWN